MSTVFSDTDHKRIADAIRAVEAETSGEIVCVVARQCEPYAIIAVMWSALAGLLAGALAAPFWPSWPITGLPLLQVGVALAVLVLLQIPSLRMRVVPSAVKHRRARRLAHTAFVDLGVHRTEGRTGILIFAAMAEHYVEIIADEGIHAKVPEGTWDTVVAEFSGHMKRGEIIAAFADAIAACGKPLTEHFPRQGGNPNERPDHLIEI